MYDVILKGGVIYDGTGALPYRADLAILNKRIACITNKINEPAREIQDVSEFWVTPGFIDIHTHYDAEVDIQPALSESVRHGHTSLIMGNCSLSLNVGDPNVNADLFARVETMPELISLWKQSATKWPSTQAYVQHLQSLNLGPHIAFLTGHSAIRAEVMGLKRSLTEHASADEINAMVKLAQEALDSGSLGISIDMVHWHRTTGAFNGYSLPSHHANYKEYAALAALCRERDAVFQLTPNPQHIWQSVFHIFKLSYGLTRAPLRCTILSAMDMAIDPTAWRAATSFASLCNRLFGANIRFQTIPEPFTIYSDGPMTPLFEEFESGCLLNNLKSTAERQALWQSPGFQKRFAKDWQQLKGRTFDGKLETLIVVDVPDKSWINCSIKTLAKRYDEQPLSFFINSLIAHDTTLRWKHTGANHRTHIRQKLMQHPFVLPGFSDAGAHCRNLAFFDSGLSLLRQSLQTNFMPFEKALKRITYEPAKWFHLPGGYISKGQTADLNVLCPKALQRPVTEASLYQDATLQNACRMVKRDSQSPIKAVYISGIKVVEQAEPLSILGASPIGSVLCSNYHAMSKQQRYQRYRNRITNDCIDHPFTSYWDIFIFKHQKLGNIVLHCVAFILMYSIAAAAFVSHNAWLLLLMPISQITGLIGHMIYEPSAVDQRDTVFSWRAFISLHKLFYFVVTQKYRSEITRVNHAYKSYRYG